MREIKFRAWDDQYQKMIFGEQTWHYGSPELFINFNGEIREESFPAEEGDEYSLDETYRKLELMQYTGLKDKNGVEIYEGDVLGLGAVPFYTVIWHDKEAMYCLADLSGENPTFDFDFSSYEVLGNIHANKDLLTS